jgi:diguanylate cyclase (GGDEF)-like protein
VEDDEFQDDRGQSAEALHRLSEALPVGVVQVDARGRVVFTNQRLHALVGTPRVATIDEQFAGAVAEDRQMLARVFETVLRNGLDDDVVIRMTPRHPDSEHNLDNDADNEERRFTVSLRALTRDHGVVTGAIACVTDVSDATPSRGEARPRATIDDVTRCQDRASTMTWLEMTLQSADDTIRPGVIVVDLDHLDAVSERLGHDAGDELLGVVAKRLVGAVRSQDVVGRIAGNEFLVVCPAMHTTAQAMRTALRIADSLRHQVKLKDGQVSCQASIGVAMSSGGVDSDTLVKAALGAMLESKRQGGGRPVLAASLQSDRASSSPSSTS